jgi:oligopeptide/dipeptide ABC transporter ATP-binding protein
MSDQRHQPSLEINHLSLSFANRDGWLKIVQDLNLLLLPGKTVGLVGESGCGKSLTALSILRLLPVHTAYGKYSEIRLKDCDILNIEQFAMRDIRGKRIAMVFQEPMASLNPVRSMYHHMVDVISAHQKMKKPEMDAYILKLLEDVELYDMHHKIHEYPHQWSGGQKQRFLIAMALASRPEILLADEPTTALDLVVQRQILLLLKKLQRQYGLALLLISHDFNVVNVMADQIVVMYAGQVIENSPAQEFWKHPLHPYVHQLMNSVPSYDKRGELLSVIPGQVPNFYELPTGCRFHPRCSFAFDKCQKQMPKWHQISSEHRVRCHLYPRTQAIQLIHSKRENIGFSLQDKPTILKVENLWVAKKYRGKHQGYILKDVHFQLKQGETLAVVGESGSGKTTLAHTLMGLVPHDKGKFEFSEKIVKQDIQLVFQDSYSAMNPRWTIQQVLTESQIEDGHKNIEKMLDAVQMSKSCLKHYPHELSGGQRQRIAIARALLANPKVLICDEPTSALDISVQAQILNLLNTLQKEMGLTYILITHDLDVVGYMADEMIILKDGELVEQGLVVDIWSQPQHEYTKSLLQSSLSKEIV